MLYYFFGKNFSKKNNFFLLTPYLLLPIFLLFGCVEAEIRLDINEDETGRVSQSLLIDREEYYSLLEDDENFLEPFIINALDRGYEVEKTETEEQIGFIAQKNINDIKGFTLKPLSNLLQGELTVNTSKNIIKNQYSVNGEIKALVPDKSEEQLINEEYALEKHVLGNNMDARVVVSLPVTPLVHNAHINNSDGEKTSLCWNLQREQHTPIYAKYRTWDITPLYYLSGSLLFLGLIGGVWVSWRRKEE